jgi:hypothetical protein
MLKFVSSCVRPLLLGLVILAMAAPAAQAGGSLARFKGSGVGWLLISQGSTVIGGNANPKVKATARAATFTIKCSVNNVPTAPYVIKLKNGHASINHMLPGVSGFEGGVTGTYRFHGKTVRVTAPFPGGTLYMGLDAAHLAANRVFEQHVTDLHDDHRDVAGAGKLAIVAALHESRFFCHLKRPAVADRRYNSALANTSAMRSISSRVL